jgi:hypothetical protein
MKASILSFFFLVTFNTSFSQTLAEWTQQKKTQRKYLIQQIAALQTHLQYLKKGYDIAHKGITTVKNIKNGEWDLHKDYFGSLLLVNPAIKNYARVADIISVQVRMVKQVRSLIDECGQRKLLSPGEIDYVVKTCDHLLSECLKNMEELILVITSGQLEMKDDERIKMIETIYAAMQEKSVFLLSFGNSVTTLSKQRLYDKIELELSEKINDINR